eukprot:2623809-Pyramimonas_sp.AAC.1
MKDGRPDAVGGLDTNINPLLISHSTTGEVNSPLRHYLGGGAAHELEHLVSGAASRPPLYAL